MSRRPSRRLLVPLLIAGVVGSLSVVTIPAAADHTDPARTQSDFARGDPVALN